MTRCKLISYEEYRDRTRFGAQKGDAHVFLESGMMWMMPWVWDHQDPDQEQYLFHLLRNGDRRTGPESLSPNYLDQWARLRDPLAIMLPTPYQIIFYPDSKPTPETKGWRVKGPLPDITVCGGGIILGGGTGRASIQGGEITVLTSKQSG